MAEFTQDQYAKIYADAMQTISKTKSKEENARIRKARQLLHQMRAELKYTIDQQTGHMVAGKQGSAMSQLGGGGASGSYDPRTGQWVKGGEVVWQLDEAGNIVKAKKGTKATPPTKPIPRRRLPKTSPPARLNTIGNKQPGTGELNPLPATRERRNRATYLPGQTRTGEKGVFGVLDDLNEWMKGGTVPGAAKEKPRPVKPTGANRSAQKKKKSKGRG